MDCRIQIIHTVAPWNANVESIMETLWRLITVSVTLIMGYNRSYPQRWLGFTVLAYEQCNEKKNPIKKKTKSKIKQKHFQQVPSFPKRDFNSFNKIKQLTLLGELNQVNTQ